ncbi:hypothetical protein ES703_51887 [subsurface metagenome]
MAYENLLTYTEVDHTEDHLKVYANKVQAIPYIPWTYAAYLYFDYGVNHFNNLSVNFEIFCENQPVLPNGVGAIGFSNVIGNISDWAVGNVYCSAQSRGSNIIWIILRGSGTYDTFIGVASTLYYCTMLRSAGGDTVTLKIYSDAARTEPPLDTLTVDGFGTAKWQYSYAFVNQKSETPVPDRLFTGFIQNLDLAAVVAPGVTTDPATSVKERTADLNGTLDDDGGQECNCGFDYGLTTGYGIRTPWQSKYSGQTFAQIIGGLYPNKTYHFRAYAENTEGMGYGGDRTFTTLPAEALGKTRGFAFRGKGFRV